VVGDAQAYALWEGLAMVAGQSCIASPLVFCPLEI
jgi:hypothetical protein